MSKRAGISPRVLGASAAISVVVAAALISWGLVQQTDYERQANQQSAENAWHTQQYIDHSCVNLPPLDKYNCAVEAHRKQRDNERTEQNNAANKKAALWTSLGAAAAIVGALLSSVGIWLIFSTFVQNRRAADAAHDANRPWVEIKITELIEFNAANLKFKATIRNAGKSPATNLLYRALLIPMRVDKGEWNGREVTLETMKTLMDKFEMEGRNAGNTLFPSDCGDEVPLGANCPPEALATGLAIDAEIFDFYVGVCAMYRWGDQWCRTGIVRMVTTNPRQHFPVNIKLWPGQFQLSGMSADYAT